MRITDALRDRDMLRAAGRLSLMAEGFGGGTDIGGALRTFNRGYVARALNDRTAVLILSDGYIAPARQRRWPRSWRGCGGGRGGSSG
ncbi:hypothetical protein KU6B_24980 [Mameliella alba]|uniref:VWA domain-containing protein n=1 Tax=Mameliella alba TaxID=561184 RepID=UPI0013E49987|nr:VWA domain-containing protein [Mameliella alba]BBU56233.1 hypothetical protein KU6B_24980 [Mameliella alba]